MYSRFVCPYRAWPARPVTQASLVPRFTLAITFRAFGPEQVALNLVPSLPDPFLPSGPISIAGAVRPRLVLEVIQTF